MSADKIKETLALLDSGDDSHWTDDGLPRLDVVSSLSGVKVTRDDVNQIAPGFSRGGTTTGGAPKTDAAAVERARIEALKAQVKGQQAAVEEQQQVVAAEAAKLREMNAQTDARIKELETAEKDSPVANQLAIMEFLRVQHETRIARHAAQAALLKGIDPKILGKGSRLDQALARKAGRGGNRPDFSQSPQAKARSATG